MIVFEYDSNGDRRQMSEVNLKELIKELQSEEGSSEEIKKLCWGSG